MKKINKFIGGIGARKSEFYYTKPSSKQYILLLVDFLECKELS